MQKSKKLPFVLAILITLFTAACNEVDITPRAEEDDEPTPVPLPPSKSSTTSSDTVTIG